MDEDQDEVRHRVGRNIKRLRRLRGMSQEELGEKVDLTAKHISRMERGDVNITIDALTSIGRRLSVGVAEFFRRPSADASAAPTYTITGRDLREIEDLVKRVKSTRDQNSD
jgi:transcriptional regulator with XRE-family HTH domain